MTTIADPGLPQLRALWQRICGVQAATAAPDPVVWAADRLVIDGLGLALRDTLRLLHGCRPDYEAFLAWVLARNGGTLDPGQVASINAAVEQALGRCMPAPAGLPPDFVPVFDDADLQQWGEAGYVVLHQAVPAGDARAAAEALWAFLEVDPGQPGSWRDAARRDGIMVPLVRHPALDRNRASPRIRAAFAQLWGTDALQAAANGGGFIPPEPSPGSRRAPDLHWDTSLVQPIPLRIDGLLYLTDTPADQGAFQCVPGFHRRIGDWLAGLPAGTDPRAQDLSSQAVAVPGCAGDLVVWHGALPHGPGRNRSARPRTVQYVAFYPPGVVDCRPWR